MPVIVARTGSAPVEPIGNCPLVAAPRAVIAAVPEPKRILWSVNVAAPVPPFATIRGLTMPIVTVPSPSSVISISFAVPAIQEVKSVILARALSASD